MLKKNLRMTSQKDVILDVVSKDEGYFSAGELCDLVKGRHAGIGRATVYRTLKLMTDAGIARVIDFADGMVRYEHNYGLESRSHIVCGRCGVNTEVAESLMEGLQERLSEMLGFVVTGHRTDIFGLCADCQK